MTITGGGAVGMGDGVLAPSSFAQQRMWVMQQHEAGRPTYNVQIGLRFRGAFDAAALRRVLADVVARHETLRTRLVWREGELAQLIDPSGDVRLHTSSVPDGAAGADARWREVAERELDRPFDLAAEAPLRSTLLELAPDDHVLLLTLDHLACDAWSLRVLHDEVVALYTAFAAAEPSPLADLPLRYADFARWQRRWIAGEERERQRAYWSEQLAGPPPRLRLYGQRERRAGDATSRSREHPIPEPLVRSLDALARGEAGSLFAALLAGFAALMSRYAGQEEFVLGSLLAGRTRPEVEGLVGFFVNTVGLRMDLTGGPTFRDLIARVRDTTLDAYTHQDLPFDEVVRAVLPEGAPRPAQPLFDIMFQYADVSRRPARTATTTIEPLPMRDRPAPMDLVVAVVKEGYGHACVWDYRSDVFEHEAVERMHDQYLRLLAAAVADPDRPMVRLPLTTDAERARLLTVPTTPTDARPTSAGPTDAADDDGWTVARVVQVRAAETPGANAVVAGGRRSTYRQLDKDANRLAHLLRGYGVGSEVPVGVLLDRGLEQVVAFLAILKAGGAYLPLDPAHPAQRLEHLLSDAAPVLVITSSDLAGPLPRGTGPNGGSGPVVVEIDAIDAELQTVPATPPPVRVHPDNTAYIIYTSGSTGLPKGTIVPHRGLRTVVDALADGLRLTRDDRILRFASASFDASILEMLMAFGAGGTLHIAPPGVEVLADLAGFLAAGEITTVMLPPSTLAAVADHPLPALRTVAVGGEACPANLAARWAPGRRFHNLYGPTEATILSTYHTVAGVPDDRVPIGRPLPGMAGYVLDDAMQLVPIGMPGELYLGGPVLARGYLRQPGLSAQRFVADPFGPPGSRLYRTGDLVRWSAPGIMEFLGRRDQQVKLRGFRIELAEIEHALAAGPGVRDAVVVLRDDPPAGSEIVGYVVPQPGAALEPATLRSMCAETLPGPLVPAHIVVIDWLPTTTSGKLDQGALPAPRRGEPEDRPAAPTSPLEAAIAEVWDEVLGTGGIASDDDFFDLGGNSLTATQVIIRLRDALDLDLAIAVLFEHPALADFTEAVRRAASAPSAESDHR